MAAVKDLFVDLQGAYFVSSITAPAPFSWPAIFHTDNLNFAIRFLKANVGGAMLSSPYTLVDISAASLTAKLWDLAGATVLAQQTVWAADTTNQVLSAALNLNTANMIAAIAAVSSLQAVLEFTLLLADGQYTVQTKLTITKSLNASGAPAPAPGVHYLTSDEANGIFAKFDNSSGQTITLRNGTKKIVLSVGPNGEFRADPQQ